jgi:Protein of unknown function (DUF1524)
MPRRFTLLLIGMALLIAAATMGCSDLQIGDASPPAQGGVPVAVRPADAAAASKQLATLTVAEPQPGGYQRTRDFGPAWSYDADHNGCRQRDDVLRRDLSQVQLRNRCTVLAGLLTDPYTGQTVQFRKANADKVQIDHIFPLAAAWAHGARAWPQRQRETFANDLLNLVATSGEANQQKGDDTPAEWQPRAGARCFYAVRYVTVAGRYHLSVSAADKRALSAMLGTCPR